MDGSARRSFLLFCFRSFKNGVIFCGVVTRKKATDLETLIGKVVD